MWSGIFLTVIVNHFNYQYIYVFCFKGSYTWSDGTTLNFIKWKVGEPSNIGTHGQIEQCVELDRDNATYNDISCFTNKGYVCKSPKGIPYHVI